MLCIIALAKTKIVFVFVMFFKKMIEISIYSVILKSLIYFEEIWQNSNWSIVRFFSFISFFWVEWTTKALSVRQGLTFLRKKSIKRFGDQYKFVLVYHSLRLLSLYQVILFRFVLLFLDQCQRGPVGSVF